MPTVKQQLKAAYADRRELEKAAARNRADRKANNELIAQLEAQDAAEAAPAHVVSPEGIDSSESVRGS